MSARTLAALATALLLAACVDTSGRPVATGGTEEPSPAAGASTVEVTNQNWSLVAVYAHVDGTAVRLGEVETGRTATLPLPARAGAAVELELVIDPLASETVWRSGRLLIAPGSVIELVVENHLPLTFVRVRGR